ncbi:MAG: glycosyltransferase family 1 protein [Firmicutes bacterium HGW-Firmicutes-8]|nr:MAG: glycosyltransferase family 1 protein [Firmicutes bacterium HGW-Firmicutes-8]
MISYPIRVLIITNTMDAGGAETFIMKVFRTIDKEKIVFDFLVSERKAYYYDNEIKILGGKIHYGFPKSKYPLKSFFNILNTVKKGKYSVIFRLGEHPVVFVDLLAAKIGGAKVRIVRSTNSSVGGGKLSEVLAAIFRPSVNMISNLKYSPSTEAAKWLFGRRAVQSGKVQLINNGIEIEKFVFNEQKGLNIRRQFNLDGKFIIGHIGRFNQQKNHMFLLDIFKEIKSKKNNSVLLLVGNGELETNIKCKVNNLNLGDSVIFTGVRSDVPDLLMAMDVLLYPSLYEGMPNVVIEAQATGLPCVISDSITPEVVLTQEIHRVSLQLPTVSWADEVLHLTGEQPRNNAHLELIDKGYDIKKTAELITHGILNCLGLETDENSKEGKPAIELRGVD